MQAGGGQRDGHFRQRVLPVGAMHNQLGDHRVVKRRHFTAGRDPAIDADVFGEKHFGQHAGAWLEILQRIFCVNTHFHRRALRGFFHCWPVRRFTGGDVQHAFEQVQTGDHFGDRMLNLQTGVYFEKIKFVARGVIDKFNRTGAAVVHRFAELHGGAMQCFAAGLRQIRRRGFFHHFLIAALQRTVTLAEGHHAAFAVAENLHFNVAGAIDKAFQKHTGITEKLLAETFHAVPCGTQCLVVITARQTNAPAACGAFQHDGITNFGGSFHRVINAVEQTGARRHRHIRGTG
ncbi:hypothetical protein SRABI106_04729 [Rahnella aquatilis]|nr:hypothetical protein SRABI106_04729 [Rahnella aquatilis]